MFLHVSLAEYQMQDPIPREEGPKCLGGPAKHPVPHSTPLLQFPPTGTVFIGIILLRFTPTFVAALHILWILEAVDFSPLVNQPL